MGKNPLILISCGIPSGLADIIPVSAIPVIELRCCGGKCAHRAILAPVARRTLAPTVQRTADALQVSHRSIAANSDRDNVLGKGRLPERRRDIWEPFTKGDLWHQSDPMNWPLAVN